MKMTANEILAITRFLGDALTDQQADELMDAIRELSIEDRERILDQVDGPFYTEMSQHNAEMGGLSRY
jgi:hypothetical protein